MDKRMILLSLASFAIGTEGFMIAGILPTLAQYFNVSLSAAGQLVTIFSLVYAIGSPILATLTGRWDKKRVLITAILVFAAGNVAAGFASVYGLMVAGRVVAAIGAGWFIPASTASVAALVPAAQRGRAISTVIAGQTVAIMLGVPLGTLIAIAINWRMTFWIVAIVAAAAALLIRRLFPAIPSPGSATLRERLSCLRNPVLLSALLTTLAWGIGIFALYTYVADIFAGFGATSRMLSLVLFFDGIACLIGVNLGGYFADRFGSSRTIALSLSLLTVSMALLSILGGVTGLSGEFAVALGTLALALWGASGYAFNPAQQHRLIGLSGPASGIVLSLHASATHLGSALGALTGGWVVQYGSASGLGYFGGGWTLLALGVFGISLRLAAARKVPAAGSSCEAGTVAGGKS
jgi:predicted MFS family arabinose efflux permease